jgi:hypothetical protein
LVYQAFAGIGQEAPLSIVRSMHQSGAAAKHMHKGSPQPSLARLGTSSTPGQPSPTQPPLPARPPRLGQHTSWSVKVSTSCRKSAVPFMRGQAKPRPWKKGSTNSAGPWNTSLPLEMTLRQHKAGGGASIRQTGRQPADTASAVQLCKQGQSATGLVLKSLGHR